jgi:hypothetical protein
MCIVHIYVHMYTYVYMHMWAWERKVWSVPRVGHVRHSCSQRISYFDREDSGVVLQRQTEDDSLAVIHNSLTRASGRLKSRRGRIMGIAACPLALEERYDNEQRSSSTAFLFSPDGTKRQCIPSHIRFRFESQCGRGRMTLV